MRHLDIRLQLQNFFEQSVFAHADSPDFSLPDHSPVGGIFSKKFGFSVTFCQPDFYHVNDLLATLPTIVTNVQLYPGDSEYHHAKYEGELPFNLSFDDDRTAVISKLGAGAWQFPLAPPFLIERFDLLDRWILAKYADNASRISMMQVGLKPKKPKSTVLPKIVQPDIHALQSVLTKSWDIVQAALRFDGIDLSAFTATVAGEECPHRDRHLANARRRALLPAIQSYRHSSFRPFRRALYSQANQLGGRF